MAFTAARKRWEHDKAKKRARQQREREQLAARKKPPAPKLPKGPFYETAYARRLREQGGVCAICDRKPDPGQRFDRDHNHKTGEQRKLLCSNCNKGLGLFRDSTYFLDRAVGYLDKYGFAGRSLWEQ